MSGKTVQSPGPSGLLCHLTMVFMQTAGFAQLQVSNVWCCATPERRGSLTLREASASSYSHALRFLHLPSLFLLPVYFRNSLQTPGALGILHSSSGGCLPHLFFSNTCTSHVSPYSLSNHTLFSLCFFTRALIFSLTKDMACTAFHFFFSSHCQDHNCFLCWEG